GSQRRVHPTTNGRTLPRARKRQDSRHRSPQRQANSAQVQHLQQAVLLGPLSALHRLLISASVPVPPSTVTSSRTPSISRGFSVLRTAHYPKVGPRTGRKKRIGEKKQEAWRRGRDSNAPFLLSHCDAYAYAIILALSGCYK